MLPQADWNRSSEVIGCVVSGKEGIAGVRTLPLFNPAKISALSG